MWQLICYQGRIILSRNRRLDGKKQHPEAEIILEREKLSHIKAQCSLPAAALAPRALRPRGISGRGVNGHKLIIKSAHELQIVKPTVMFAVRLGRVLVHLQFANENAVSFLPGTGNKHLLPCRVGGIHCP